MSTSIRIILMLVIWLIYMLIAYFGCLKPCCDLDAVGVIPEGDKDTTLIAPIQPNEPIYSSYGDPMVDTTTAFTNMRTSLMADNADDRKMEITGYYYEGEPKPAGYENIGFLRADNIRTIMSTWLPEAKFADLRSAMRDATAPAPYFLAGRMRWIDAEPEDEHIVEIDDRVEILFDFDSDDANLDASIIEYLDNLAMRIKETQESVSLTGHTDNVDDEQYNLRLGRKRAQDVKAQLLKRGVPKELITTASKGETEPTATNETSAGRRQNRRVVVRLLKKN